MFSGKLWFLLMLLWDNVTSVNSSTDLNLEYVANSFCSKWRREYWYSVEPGVALFSICISRYVFFSQILCQTTRLAFVEISWRKLNQPLLNAGKEFSVSFSIYEREWGEERRRDIGKVRTDRTHWSSHPLELGCIVRVTGEMAPFICLLLEKENR